MVDPNHSLWLSASHLPALRLPMILTKTSTKTDKSSFSQKRLISLSPHLIFRTTPFYFVTYSPFCNLIGLQYALQREQLALDQTLSARARGCGYARLGVVPVSRVSCRYPGPRESVHIKLLVSPVSFSHNNVRPLMVYSPYAKFAHRATCRFRD